MCTIMSQYYVHNIYSSSYKKGLCRRATRGAGTTYSTVAPEFTPCFYWGYMLLKFQIFVQCFVDRCLSFCPFSFGHCVVGSSKYGFLLPLSSLPIFCRRIHQYMNITVYLNLVMIWPDMCTSSYLITSCHCCTIQKYYVSPLYDLLVILEND